MLLISNIPIVINIRNQIFINDDKGGDRNIKIIDRHKLSKN